MSTFENLLVQVRRDIGKKAILGLFLGDRKVGGASPGRAGIEWRVRVRINFAVHRDNIECTQDMLDFAIRLEADYVELANTQTCNWGGGGEKPAYRKRQVDSRASIPKVSRLFFSCRKPAMGALAITALWV